MLLFDRRNYVDTLSVKLECFIRAEVGFDGWQRWYVVDGDEKPKRVDQKFLERFDVCACRDRIIPQLCHSIYGFRSVLRGNEIREILTNDLEGVERRALRMNTHQMDIKKKKKKNSRPWCDSNAQIFGVFP